MPSGCCESKISDPLETTFSEAVVIASPNELVALTSQMPTSVKWIVYKWKINVYKWKIKDFQHKAFAAKEHLALLIPDLATRWMGG